MLQSPHASSGKIQWHHRQPLFSMALTILFAGFALVPMVQENPHLLWSFLGLAAALMAWSLILWVLARRSGRVFRVEYYPIKAHYVQACVQFSIFLYWGLYWSNVYAELPLILAQVVYLYTLDALLSWSRGRSWRLGYGPLPVVVSTNLLLWFRHDWYVFQFLMLTVGALGKQFITWNRDGRQTHIFNPSAFGQFVFAIALIGTGTTQEYTWGKEIAATFDAPYMLLVIFLCGLVVQSLFHVTLMTVAAATTLVLLNQIYTEITGVYYFVTINIAAPIFLGIHLLITDPATSPRTNLGRVIFGSLYGMGYFILFRVLDLYGVPLFWDKLLPVPILNLCVPMIDRVVRSGFIGRVNHAWETCLPARKLNFIHMGCWIAFFATLWTTGYIEAPHPGNSIPFWKQALAEGKPHAGHSLVIAAGTQAEGGGSGAAFNELGLICMEGVIVNENHAAAAHYFARACELKDESGCVNVVLQYLVLGERRSDEELDLALESLELDCRAGGSSRSCFLAGHAYETGRGRPLDTQRAIELYEQAGLDDLYAVKGLARIALSGDAAYDVRPLIPALAHAAEAGDLECFWYLGYMYHEGIGLIQNQDKARAMLRKACELGSSDACRVLMRTELPPYENPTIIMPGWATAFPLASR